MKKRWIFWWIANIIWITLFAGGTFVVWTREVDGAGVTQTPALKLVAFIFLLIAFLYDTKSTEGEASVRSLISLQLEKNEDDSIRVMTYEYYPIN
ncbi:hypothetical protein CKF96_03695 (plasmid) [Priestia filamentosa]|nr:hypothetical protein CKF96_03695 [Priestia filamentosa]